MNRTAPGAAVLWLCYGLSGATALALEMCWMRSAGLVAGATAATIATVLAWYFGGLAIGAAAARRGAARPARRYALLELATAAAAAWSLLAFRLLAHDGAQQLLDRWTGVAPLAVGAAVLPATVCMGATLPAIGQAVVARGALARRGGLLYALNTIGGAIGIVAAGFGLPAAIGVTATYASAIGVGAVAGLLALSVGDRAPADFRAVAMAKGHATGADDGSIGARELAAPAYDATADDRPSSVGARPAGTRGALRLVVVAAATGALGLGLEVLWTRLFAQVLHNSVYSFSAVALVFVVALALGAAASAKILRRLPAGDVIAAGAGAGAVTTLLGFWLFVWWTDGLGYVGMRTGLTDYVARIVVLAATTAGPAAFASGVLLPALWSAWGDRGGVAPPLGVLTAANSAGAIAGAIGAGFLVFPSLGLRGGLLLAALAYLVIALATPATRTPLRSVLLAAVLLVPLADPLRAPIVRLRSDGESPRAVLEGASGIVSVVDTTDDLQLRLDNYYVLGGSAAAVGERRLGLVPLLLHPRPARVAFIGLATGITASAAPALDVPDTTVVELVPEVATAARRYFGSWNGNVLDRADVRLVIADGRRYLQSTRGRFDVIVSDLFVPWHAGTSSLYAREMYETAARRLAPGGLFCQWLPLYQLTRDEFDVIARTFLDVFPSTTLWRADFYPNRPVVALVGARAAPSVDLARVRQRIERLPEWGRDPLLASPLGLAMLYAGDLRATAGMLGEGALNTDDRPRIEFLAPRLTRISSAGDKDWFTGDALASFYDALAARDPASAPFVPASPATSDARRAGRALYRYAIAAARHDPAAAELEDEVRRLAPDVVAAATVALDDDDDLADARHGLATLRERQDTVRRELESVERRLQALGTGDEAAP